MKKFLALAAASLLLIAATPNDTEYNQYQDWYFTAIRAEAMWDYANGNETTPLKVGIVSTGIGYSSLPADLNDNVAAEADFTGEGTTRDTFGSVGAGTGTASIVGSETNNSQALAGMTWTVDLLNARMINTNGSSTDAGYAAAIDWAVGQGAKVLVLDRTPVSSSAGNWTNAFAEIDAALDAGITVLTGSPSQSDVGAIANFDDRVVIVGATTNTNARASFSPVDPLIDLVAPGQSIRVLASGGCCITESAQRYAVALVAGAIANLRSEGVGGWQALNAVMISAQDLGDAGEDDSFGVGLLDAQCATAKVADMNDTDDVDLSDTQAILDLFGAGPGYGETIYDMNGDDYIDLADAQISLKFFGASC